MCLKEGKIGNLKLKQTVDNVVEVVVVITNLVGHYLLVVIVIDISTVLSSEVRSIVEVRKLQKSYTESIAAAVLMVRLTVMLIRLTQLIFNT